MDKLKDYLDYIVDFCQDHSGAVIAGAAVLVILLLCFVLVRSARREDWEDELSEETEPSSQERAEPDPLPESLSETFPEQPPDPLPELLSEQPPDPLPELLSEQLSETSATKEEAEATPMREPAASDPETEIEIEGAIGGGNLASLPAQFMAQNLKSVEVHIEKAHITFHYATPECGSQELEKADRRAAGDAAEGDTSEPASDECDAGIDFTETEERQIDARTQNVKKFGAENRNVSRSGREYTVEELYVKIRD